MGVKTKSYQFKSTYGNELVYLFQTDTRKRKGQLDKYCDQHLPQDQSYEILALTKTTFESELLRFQNNVKFNLVDKPTIFDEYAATDIKIFDNKANWHEWQLKIYEKIFNHDGSFKQPDQRQIIRSAVKAMIIGLLSLRSTPDKASLKSSCSFHLLIILAFIFSAFHPF